MFSENSVYSLGIPLDTELANSFYSLILEIASKEQSISLDRKLTSRINIKSEYHITIGIFKPEGIFYDSTKKIMKKLITYLNENKEEYLQLKALFQGSFNIKGIGYEGSNIENSNVFWVSLESDQINRIRDQIHLLFQKAEIPTENFYFTMPHITLFIKKGSENIHVPEKFSKEPINKYFEMQTNFKFNTVCFYRGGKILLSFGDDNITGNPSIKFKNLLKEKLSQKNSSKNNDSYNWGNLFKSEFKKDAVNIKKTILEEGPEGLTKFGYDENTINTIMNLIK